MSESAPRLVVLGINYAPERTGNAPYTTSLSESLAEQGWDVEAIVAPPHYPNWEIPRDFRLWDSTRTESGVRVRRLLHFVPKRLNAISRLFSELSFGARSVLVGWDRPDVVLAVSPALFSVLPGVVRARFFSRVPLVVWVQDIYSKGLSETGSSTLLVKAMRAVEGWILRNATTVTVIHDRFKAIAVEEFGLTPEKVKVVRNWTHIRVDHIADRRSVRRRYGWSDDECIVLHAGNQGVKQGLENVVTAGRIAASHGEKLRFILLGGGNQHDRLRDLAGDCPAVQFIGTLASHDYSAIMQAADVLLVNELAGVMEMAVPSKLTSYMVAGRPVLAAVNLKGITAQEVSSSGAGVVVPAGDPRVLIDAALLLSSNPEAATGMGQRGQEFAFSALDRDTAIRRWAQTLRDAAAR